MDASPSPSLSPSPPENVVVSNLVTCAPLLPPLGSPRLKICFDISITQGMVKILGYFNYEAPLWDKWGELVFYNESYYYNASQLAVTEIEKLQGK